MQSKKLLVALFIVFGFFSCKQEDQNSEELQAFEETPDDIYEFGFNLNDYVVKRDTIRKGIPLESLWSAIKLVTQRFIR